MFDSDQLTALAAVLDCGSFDGAAEALHLTQPAISQRIRALEEACGATLVIRARPVRPTETGARLWRHAEALALMEQDLRRNLATQSLPESRLRIAVNADSLDTWMIPALARTAREHPALFDITSDDQDHTANRLREGEVLGAVTAHSKPVAGCDCLPLGALRYTATANPDFARKYFPDGITRPALEHAPALTFNRKDRLQKLWAARECNGVAPRLKSHFLPSTRGFVTAAEAGLGWGMNPNFLIEAQLRSGRLVALGASPEYDTPLYWQVGRRTRNLLAPLTRAIQAAAKMHLHSSALDAAGKRTTGRQ